MRNTENGTRCCTGDGKPRIMDKGGLQKSAFHVPRALYNCCLLLQGKPIFGKGGEV